MVWKFHFNLVLIHGTAKAQENEGKFVAGRDDSATKDNKSVETVTELQQAYLEARTEDKN